MRFNLVLSLILSFFLGCASTQTKQKPLEPEEAKALENWQSVLKKHIDSDGRVSIKALTANPQELDSFLQFLAKPKVLMDRNEKLSWWLNAYLAFCLKNLIDLKMPEKIESQIDRAKFYYFKKYPLFGETHSLYSVEKDLLATLDEPKVYFALSNLTISAPKFSQVPFESHLIENQLEQATKNFLNDEKNVRVDSKSKQVYLSEVLKIRSDALLKNVPSITEFINRYRKEAIPQNFEIIYIPADSKILYKTE